MPWRPEGPLAAGALLIALMLPAPGAAAESPTQCAASARRLIADLLPSAEAIAGRTLPVIAPTQVTAFWVPGHAIAERHPVAAHVFGMHILIHREFCRRSESSRRVVIAHELGHIIDNSTGAGDSAPRAADWAERSAEIRATRHALAIFRHAGLDILGFRDEFAAGHLERAAQLLGDAKRP